MTGRFVCWMNVSVDLRIEGEPSEGGAGEWLRIGEQLHRGFDARARAMSMFVEGRVTYELMDPFWPNARYDESLPDYTREYDEIWTAIPKVLVSRTPSSAAHNTRVLGGDDAIERLGVFCTEADGDIGVGGADLATQLLQAGLLDELLLFTHPAILGRGRGLFDTEQRLELDLLEQGPFDDGVTMHRYAIRSGTNAQ